MKKILPHFLLFIFILSFLGCSITKRRYTGGYYVSWHKKASDIKAINQVQNIHIATNKAELENNSVAKTEVEYPAEKTVGKTLIYTRSFSSQEKTKQNIISNIYVSQSYTIAPGNIEKDKDDNHKDISRRGVALAIVCCLLGMLTAFLVVVIIASAPFFSGASIPMAIALEYGLFPFLLLLASLFFCDMAMKNGYNMGLIACIILDTTFLLILLFSVFSLKQ